MKKNVWILFVSLFVFNSCNKVDHIDPPPQLSFTIINESGNLVNEAKVILYSTYEDWYDVVNPLDSALSDTTGKCLFKDLQEVYYFFDVNKGGDMYNSANSSSIESPLKNGTITNVTIILKKDEL